ncbi:MAG TPA: PAS domain S-box protein, partial [Stenotrophomonas sp.]|nr:PAS domain S-box protein [Stenotrophomonas sp.]
MSPHAAAQPPSPAPPEMPHLRRVTLAGVLLGLLLALGLALLLWHDWQARHEAAQRQAMALATGTQRLMAVELRNLERAMAGIGADAQELFGRVPEQAPTLLSDSMQGVVSRHAEIESIVIVNDAGTALTDGHGDPTLPAWAVPARRGPDSALYAGPPEQAGDGEWLLRLALDMGNDRWVLTRLRRSELQRLVTGLDVGRRGVVSLTDVDGFVLARSTYPGGSSDPLHLPAGSFQRAPRIMPLGDHVSVLDGRHRIAAAGTAPPYPIRVYAGLDRQEVLTPWWTLLGVTLLVFAFYVAGFVYLWRSLRRAERRQARLQAELRAGDAELRLAHQVGGIGTWCIAGNGDRLQWSEQASEMFQTPLRGLTVAAFMQRVHAQDRRRVTRGLARAWRGEEPLDIHFRLLLPALGERWVAARGAMVEDGRGGRRMTGTVVDVSERVEIQSMAMDAQRQLRLIFDLNPLPCLLFDAQTGRFLEVNPAAVREYGYSRDEFLRLRLADIEPALRERHDAPGLPPPGDSVVPLLHVHRRRNGSLIDVRVHTSQLEIAGIRARLALAENVSDHVAYQR